MCDRCEQHARRRLCSSSSQDPETDRQTELEARTVKLTEAVETKHRKLVRAVRLKKQYQSEVKQLKASLGEAESQHAELRSLLRQAHRSLISHARCAEVRQGMKERYTTQIAEMEEELRKARKSARKEARTTALCKKEVNRLGRHFLRSQDTLAELEAQIRVLKAENAHLRDALGTQSEKTAVDVAANAAVEPLSQLDSTQSDSEEDPTPEGPTDDQSESSRPEPVMANESEFELVEELCTGTDHLAL